MTGPFLGFAFGKMRRDPTDRGGRHALALAEGLRCDAVLVPFVNHLSPPFRAASASADPRLPRKLRRLPQLLVRHREVFPSGAQRRQHRLNARHPLLAWKPPRPSTSVLVWSRNARAFWFHPRKPCGCRPGTPTGPTVFPPARRGWQAYPSRLTASIAPRETGPAPAPLRRSSRRSRRELKKAHRPPSGASDLPRVST